MPPPTGQDSSLPRGARLALYVFFSCVALLLQALDSTIVSTAIPAISGHFQTTKDVGWYGSAYLLTQCAFQIFWGRLYTFYDFKITYIVAIFIFEIGSLLCAVAPSSIAFIFGRATAGVGAGGVFTGSFVLIAFSVPLVKRPMYASFLGAVYGLASVLGPPIGGAFTTGWTWRGCFYLNLPLGGIVIVGLIFFMRSPDASAPQKALPRKEKLIRLDPLGTLLLIASVACILLALEWGGSTYAWNNARIVALITLFGVTLLVWVGWQVFLGPRATVPRHIIKQRSMSFVTIYSFTQGGVQFGILYFAPIWFQAVRGNSAVKSGLDVLPFIVFLTVTMMGTGYALTKGGYSAPLMLFSITIVSIACGLLTTWTPDASDAKVFGYLSMYGFGQGFGWQQPILIAQTMLPAADIPTGVSITTVCKLLGSTIFVSVGQTLFDSKIKDLIIERLPQLNPSILRSISDTGLRTVVPPSLLPVAQSIYNDALRNVWWMLLALSLASLVGASGVEWRSVTDKVATSVPRPSSVPPQAESEETVGSSKRSTIHGATVENMASQFTLISDLGDIEAEHDESKNKNEHEIEEV